MFMKYFSLFVLFLLTACANTPEFDTTEVDPTLTPNSVISEPEVTKGKIALWGGTILDTRNLKEDTQIEILAYPLDSRHRPLLESKPLGRFIIKHVGYLEASSYAQGRQLTVVGVVSGSHSGKVGETTYEFPLIRDQQLHLWSKSSDRTRTNIHFGVGVGVIR
jgi:outer membrane lipoprotein